MLDALNLNPSKYGLLANCGDKYQSNFGPQSFQTHKPYLVIEIDGQSTHEWAASKENPAWGPYIVGIAHEEGLKDPSSKQPWGVNQLVLQPKDEFLAAVRARWPDELSPSAKHGRMLFLNHCLNCHALDGITGGNVSTRTVQILSIHAQTNPAYVRQMIYEPGKSFPEGIKMPAMPHYAEEDVKAVVEFLAAYSN